VTIRWEYSGDGRASICYFVDDEPVGSDEEGFDRMLELAAASTEPVTLRVLAPGWAEPTSSTTCRSRRVWTSSGRVDGRPLLYPALLSARQLSGA
jgi:hypothetical protein